MVLACINVFHPLSSSKIEVKMIVKCKFCEKNYNKLSNREFCSNGCNILGNIKKVGKCWEWQKGCKEFGYGQTRDLETGKSITLHRLSYKIFKGLIPKGAFVCHSCDNAKCCNPEHLWLGNCKENMQDCKEKGRTLKGNKFRAKISENDVLKIRKEYSAEMGYKKLAKKYAVDWSNIRAIIKRRSWKDI